jgi:hypothetical protein
MISAIAAIFGAAIGGITSLLATWLLNRRQVRAEWSAHDRSRREDLYKEFIEEAAKCYIDALLHEKPDIPLLVVLYAKMSRMRVISSPLVIEDAERLISQIINTYSEPVKTFTEIQAIRHGSLDIIRNFSERCRAEFDDLRAKQF